MLTLIAGPGTPLLVKSFAEFAGLEAFSFSRYRQP
jgi:hypothetical protein